MGVPLPILMVIAIIVIIFITVATILAVNKGYSFKHEIDPKPEKSYKAGERKWSIHLYGSLSYTESIFLLWHLQVAASIQLVHPMDLKHSKNTVR